MNMQFMEVTPAMAKDWVATSQGNPRWSKKLYDPKKVATIAIDILQGNWHPGTGSIAFDESGTLVDGHHRLMAVIEADKPISTIVVFGVPQSGVEHIDDNSMRSISQRLHISNSIVGLANVHLRMCGGIKSTNSSSEFVKMFVREHPLCYEAENMSLTGSDKTIARRAGCMHGILVALEFGIPKDTVRGFSASVNSGFTNSQAESSAIVIRNFLISNKRYTIKDSISLSRMTQMAIDDYYNGRMRKKTYSQESGVVYFDRLRKSGDNRYQEKIKKTE